VAEAGKPHADEISPVYTSVICDFINNSADLADLEYRHPTGLRNYRGILSVFTVSGSISNGELSLNGMRVMLPKLKS
jgi:hypothetical protein